MHSNSLPHKILCAVLISVLAITLSFVQYMLVPHIAIGQAQPDLLMILTIDISVFCSICRGTVCGFLCGVIRDLFGSGYDGVSMLIYMSAGTCFGIASAAADISRPKLSASGAGIGVLLNQLITACLCLMPENMSSLPDLLMTAVIPFVIYTAAAAAAIRPLIRQLLFFCKGSETIYDPQKE